MQTKFIEKKCKRYKNIKILTKFFSQDIRMNKYKAIISYKYYKKQKIKKKNEKFKRIETK